MTVIIIRNSDSQTMVTYDIVNQSDLIYYDYVSAQDISLQPGEQLFQKTFIRNNFLGEWIFGMKIHNNLNVFFIKLYDIDNFSKLIPIKTNSVNIIDQINNNIKYEDYDETVWTKYNSYRIIDRPLKSLTYYQRSNNWRIIHTINKNIEESYEYEEDQLIVFRHQNIYIVPNMFLFKYLSHHTYPENVIYQICDINVDKLWKKDRDQKSMEAIVIGGGGVYGISTLGAISCLEDSFNLVKIFIGTSSGAIISSLLSIGYKTKEILDYVKSINLNEMHNNSNLLGSLTSFVTTYGLSDGQKKLRYHLEELFRRRNIDPQITFYDLYEKTKKFLVVCVCCLNTGMSEYFHIGTKPNLVVIDALLMSSCLPFIWEPIKYNNNIYVDGGVVDNLPMSQIHILRPLQILMSDRDTNNSNIVEKFKQIKKNNLPVSCIGLNINKNITEIYSTNHIMNNLMNYIQVVLSTMIKSMTKVDNKYENNVVNVFVPAGISSRDFSLSKDKMDNMYRQARISFLCKQK